MSIDYLPPFAILRTALRTSPDGETVTLSKEVFTMLLSALAEAAGFDPVWYRAAYPDAAAAVDRGEFGSEMEHFSEVGFAGGRFHRAMLVDDDWYRRQYPDVDQAIREADDMTTQDHFNEFGYFEGRANHAVAEAQALKWAEAIERSRRLSGADPTEA